MTWRTLRAAILTKTPILDAVYIKVPSLFCRYGILKFSRSNYSNIAIFAALFCAALISACAPIIRSGNSNVAATTAATDSDTDEALSTDFISIWRTSSPSESITLPLRSGYSYTFSVDWGDSTSDIITAFDDAAITHTYAAAGDYTVTISGTLEAWYFNNSGDSSKIIEVVNFGDNGWTNLENAFFGCSNMTSFAGGVTTNVTNMNSMFSSATSLTSLDLTNFDTSNVTDMYAMFANASSLTSLDLSSFNTAGVTNMGFMFQSVSSLTSLDLSSFNTIGVTNMRGMFTSTSSLTSLDLTNFDTSNVSDMGYMFNYASSLTSLDLSNFDTSNVSDMGYMFNYASSLTTLNTTDWDLGLASASTNVFTDANASIVVTCNQGGTPGTGTFFGKSCASDGPAPFISIWRITSVPGESITLPLRDGFNYNFTVDWGDSTSTSDITSAIDPDRSHFYSSSGDYTVTITGTAEAWYFNDSGDKDKIIEVVNFGDLGWTNLENAFYGCLNLTSFAGGITDQVTDTRQMFSNATSLTTIDVSTWDTSQLTYMNYMFDDTAVTSLNLSNFDTSNVTNMSNLFSYTTSLTSLNTTGWDLSGIGIGTSDVFTNTNAGIVVTCDQGGSPGTGTFFGKTCN